MGLLNLVNKPIFEQPIKKVEHSKLILSIEQIKQLKKVLDNYRLFSNMSYYSSIIKITEDALNTSGLMQALNTSGIKLIQTSELTHQIILEFKNKILVYIYCNSIKDKFIVTVKTDNYDEINDIEDENTVFEKEYVNPFIISQNYKRIKK